MKKNQQSKQGIFELIERKTLEDFASRKGYYSSPENIEREKQILTKLKSREKKGEFLTNMYKRIYNSHNVLEKGHKYPLLARNTKYAKPGRRFAYIGIDNKIHIGRNGKPLKIPMA